MPNNYKELLLKLEGDPDSLIIEWAPPATEEQIREVERQIGATLPNDYRDFLLTTNGCEFPDYVVTFDDEVLSTLFGVDALLRQFHFLRDHFDFTNEEADQKPDPARNIYEGLTLVRENKVGSGWPKELLEIGSSPGSSGICLAISGLRPGAIFDWAEGHLEVILAADSFDEFLHKLYRED